MGLGRKKRKCRRGHRMGSRTEGVTEKLPTDYHHQYRG